MARNRFLYCLTVLACLAFSAAYRENISAIILSAVLLYPILAGITVLVLSRAVKAVFSENSIFLEKGTRFELKIDVKNSFILPCVPMRLLCDLPDEDTGLVVRKEIFVTLPPLGKSQLSLGCTNKYRGEYRFGIRKISVFDPLRIIRVTKNGKSEVNAVFVPRRLSVADIKDFGESDSYNTKKQRTVENREDFSHVREYIPGENVQLVHWKLTAKTDNLMLKQFDSEYGRKARILCDLKSCRESSDALLSADTVIETALAFAAAFLGEGVVTDVDFGQNDSPPFEISNQQDFERFFDAASVISPTVETCGICELIDKTVDEESILVIITSSLSEEIAVRADKLGANETVFAAYINLPHNELKKNMRSRRFVLLNIRSDGQEYLSLAMREALKNMEK